MEKQQEITACAFLHKDGKLFIAKRAATKEFLPDKWELPGGHIEFGETMEESLVREIQEEMHIAITVGNPFYAFTYISDTTMTHTIEVEYFAEMKDPSQEIRLNPEDHSDCKWITKDEVATYFEEGDQEKTAILRGFTILPLFLSA